MRLLRLETLSGPENMARDQAMLQAAERGVRESRVYAWEGPWVSLGRFQKPEQTLIDPGMMRWVMRPTGGKAVLHGHDITVALALPLGASLYGRRVKAVYHVMVQPIVVALRSCGVSASLGEGSGDRVVSGSADCFASSAPVDVVEAATGTKLCGCALRITRSAALLQASIPYRRPLVDAPELIVGGVPWQGPEWDVSNFIEALDRALDPAEASSGEIYN